MTRRLKKARRKAGRRTGGALLVVLLSVIVALTGGFTLLISATTATGLSVIVADHAQARQIAESGLSIALASIERSEDWRADLPPGEWLSDAPLLGGEVTISADYPGSAALLILDDRSFEDETASLPTPLLSPPMSGVIGGWEAERAALVETGPTVPLMGMIASPDATDGFNVAEIAFTAGVNGAGVFRQGLGAELEPNHMYSVSFDVSRDGLPPLHSSFGCRLYADNTLVASTTEALTLFDGLPLIQILSESKALLVSALYPATLAVHEVSGSSAEYTLRFISYDDPPPGELRLEFYARSLGVLSSVSFDDVRIDTWSNDEVWITSVGAFGESSHVTMARIVDTLAGDARIVEWRDP